MKFVIGICTIFIKLSLLQLGIHTCRENWGIPLCNAEAFLLDLKHSQCQLTVKIHKL